MCNAKQEYRLVGELSICYFMSRTPYRVNLRYIVASMSRNSLLETGAISDVLRDSIRILTHNHLVCKKTLNHLANLAEEFVYELSGFGFESRRVYINTPSKF